MTSGAMPERHRELIPIAGLTGSARSATGAQRRSTTAMSPHKVEQAGLTGVSAWVRGRRTRTPTRRAGVIRSRERCERSRGTTDHPGVVRLSVLKAWAVGPPQDRAQPLKVTVPGHKNLAVASGATKRQGRHVVRAARHVSIEGLHGCKASEYSAHEAQR